MTDTYRPRRQSSVEARRALSRWTATGAPIDDATARTIAARWNGPDWPAITRLSHGLPVNTTSLRAEVRYEREFVTSAKNSAELDALIDWIERQA